MEKAICKQTFIGIWFHDNTLSIDQQDKMKLYLNRTFYYYRIFVDTVEFYTYIDKERLVTKVFLISSISDYWSLSSLIKLARQYPQVFEKFYIFLPAKINTSVCFNTTNIDDLFGEISKDIDGKMNPSSRVEDKICAESKPITTSDIEEDLPALIVFDSKLTQAMPIRHLTKESFKFISFLIMRNILIQQSYGKKELREMCATCRGLHKNDKNKLKQIDKLQVNYNSNEAIQHYTESSFLFRTINQICGTENMKEIYKFRTYISDLYNQLKQLDKEQEESDLKECIKKVYRGKLLAGSVLQQLMDNKGGLVSMNGFLSTTMDRDMALTFAGTLENKDEGMKSTLFLLKIDKKVSQPYAYISPYSKMPAEEEVLFSLGTIWRIESIVSGPDFYTIELSSCEEHDSELAELLKKCTSESVTLISLGDILLEFGDKDGAEWCYRKMLDQQSNDDETAGILYYKIGMIQFEKNLYPEALTNLTKAESLIEQSENKLNGATSLRPMYKYRTGSPLFNIRSTIGYMLDRNAIFDEAIKNYEQAIKTYENALNEKSTDQGLATVHHNLGYLHFRLGFYAVARECQEKACKLADSSHKSSKNFENNLKCTKAHLGYIAEDEGKK